MKRFVILSILLTPFLGACVKSSLPDDLPKLVPCKLQFTQEGEPLVGATVFLRPLDDSNRWFPGGETDDKGNVELFSNGRYQGAPIGKYKIVVLKSESDPTKLPPAPEEGSPGYDAWLKKAEREVLPSYTLVEKSYTDVSTTPLEIDITDEKNIERSFDVGKKGRVRIQ